MSYIMGLTPRYRSPEATSRPRIQWGCAAGPRAPCAAALCTPPPLLLRELLDAPSLLEDRRDLKKDPFPVRSTSLLVDSPPRILVDCNANAAIITVYCLPSSLLSTAVYRSLPVDSRLCSPQVSCPLGGSVSRRAHEIRSPRATPLPLATTGMAPAAVAVGVRCLW